MKFWCDGRQYESRAMRQFLTNDPTTPLILKTADHRHVFVMTVQGCQGCQIHQANTLEIMSLASRHGLGALLEAFPASIVGEVRLEVG
jgi:hypothetical protein